MRNHQDPAPTPEGAALARRVAQEWLRQTDLVPLALIAVETGEPLDHIAHVFAHEVVLDDVGMRAVRADVARRFFTERAEQTARMRAQSRRMREEAARRSQPVSAGVPALEGASPFEAMVAAGGVVTPQEEFGRGGSVYTQLLDEELAKGRRAERDKRAQAEALKDALRGK